MDHCWNSKAIFLKFHKNFWHGSLNPILRVQRNTLNDFFLKNWYQSFSFSVFERKLFALPAIVLGRAVKIAVYVCRETFWTKIKTWKKNNVFAFSDRKGNIFVLFAEKVQHGCQNCIIRVQTIILRKRTVSRRRHFFHNISGLSAEKV